MIDDKKPKKTNFYHEGDSFKEAIYRDNLPAVMRAVKLGRDPKENESEALISAANANAFRCVKYLAPLSDATANNSFALKTAIGNQNLEMVKVLLPLSNPKAEGSYSLQIACKTRNAEFVNLLIPYSDIEEAIHGMTVQRREDDILFLKSVIESTQLHVKYGIEPSNKISRGL